MTKKTLSNGHRYRVDYKSVSYGKDQWGHEITGTQAIIKVWVDDVWMFLKDMPLSFWLDNGKGRWTNWGNEMMERTKEIVASRENPKSPDMFLAWWRGYVADRIWAFSIHLNEKSDVGLAFWQGCQEELIRLAEAVGP